MDRVDDVLRREAHRAPVDRDGLGAVDVAGRVADDLARDRHAALADDALGGAAGGDAGVGEELREAHGAREASLSGAPWTCSSSTRPWAASASLAFRAKQVWEWTARGAGGYDEMTNLPAALRDRAGRARCPSARSR